jgi:hypothetical protein
LESRGEEKQEGTTENTEKARKAHSLGPASRAEIDRAGGAIRSIPPALPDPTASSEPSVLFPCFPWFKFLPFRRRSL